MADLVKTQIKKNPTPQVQLPPAPPGSRSDYSKMNSKELVAMLGDDKYRKRIAAQRELAKRPKSVPLLIRAVVRSGDPELGTRAAQVLGSLVLKNIREPKIALFENDGISRPFKTKELHFTELLRTARISAIDNRSEPKKNEQQKHTAKIQKGIAEIAYYSKAQDDIAKYEARLGKAGLPVKLVKNKSSNEIEEMLQIAAAIAGGGGGGAGIEPAVKNQFPSTGLAMRTLFAKAQLGGDAVGKRRAEVLLQVANKYHRGGAGKDVELFRHGLESAVELFSIRQSDNSKTMLGDIAQKSEAEFSKLLSGKANTRAVRAVFEKVNAYQRLDWSVDRIIEDAGATLFRKDHVLGKMLRAARRAVDTGNLDEAAARIELLDELHSEFVMKSLLGQQPNYGNVVLRYLQRENLVTNLMKDESRKKSRGEAIEKIRHEFKIEKADVQKPLSEPGREGPGEGDGDGDGGV